jgi:hypothetical protein
MVGTPPPCPYGVGQAAGILLAREEIKVHVRCTLRGLLGPCYLGAGRGHGCTKGSCRFGLAIAMHSVRGLSVLGADGVLLPVHQELRRYRSAPGGATSQGQFSVVTGG